MISRAKLLSASSLAILAASPVLADVTAQQVWDDWRTQLEMNGGDSLSIGAEMLDGDTLTVSDLTFSYSDDDVSVFADLGDIVLTENGDGTVSVTMDQDYPIVFSAEDVEMIFRISHRGMKVTVSGQPDALQYDTSAEKFDFVLDSLETENEDVKGDIRVSATDLMASSRSTPGDIYGASGATTIGKLELLVDIAPNDGSGEYLTFAGNMQALDVAFDAKVPTNVDMEDPNALMQAGFALSGAVGLGRADYVFDINMDGDVAQGSVSNGAAQISGAISNDVLRYASQTNDIAMSLAIPQFPMPITFSAAGYGYNFEAPTSRSDDARPIAAGFNLTSVAVSDQIWDMFEPSSTLPRDPITLQLSLVGTARALFDFFDPAQQDAMMNSDMPFALETLNLETLVIDGLGAMVAGGGQFTFDNSDMDSFAPLPRPEGEAGLRIDGLNALLDKLIDTGLIPEEEVMAPRMMMGMFTRSVGDDQMAIDIEINEKGQVKVNGNRVR